MKKRTKDIYQQRLKGIKGPKPRFPYLITNQMAREIRRYNMPITEESFRRCLDFIYRCCDQSHEDISGDATFYLEELMTVLSGLYADVILDGNFRLSGSLPRIRKTLNNAYRKYRNAVRIKPRPRHWYNRFVEYLYRGYLWDGGNPRRICPWAGEHALPPVDNINAWMKLIEPFLKQTFKQPLDIIIFRPMLKSHKAIYAQNPNKDKLLGEDLLCYQWDQIFKKIRNAWLAMARRYKTSPAAV